MANINHKPSKYMYNLQHVLPAFVKKEKNIINGIIEINSGSINKYELITESGQLKLDRVGYSSLAYPVSYGAIPQTWDQDNDMLDFIIANVTEPLIPGSLVEARVIGIMKFEDGGERDDKIITVLSDDKRMDHINSYEELGEHWAKETEHYFFKLQNFKAQLHEWTRNGHLQPQVTKKLDEWFSVGLQDWDISRDAPYFGFKIPGEENKYFYCWLDAPVGYIASFQNFAERHPDYKFSHYWENDSKTELYHFIGKDILYFHTLFWPAVLSGADLRTPTAIFCHGFLTIDGYKMSKSRGTYIKAQTYLKHLQPEYFRYYLATKLNDQIEDMDINFDDFTQRVNSDLVGKFINIASRCASFINKNFDGKLAKKMAKPELYDGFVKEGDSIAEKYEARDFNQATRQIMALADRANQYIDECKPWAMIKNPELEHDTQAVCTLGINLFRLLAIYLKPVLPSIAQKIEAFLMIPPLQWSDKNKPLLNHTVALFQPLAQRLEKTHIDAMKHAAQDA